MPVGLKVEADNNQQTSVNDIFTSYSRKNLVLSARLENALDEYRIKILAW